MNKKMLLALILALAMLLTGCSLIEKDPVVDQATQIIKVGDTVITKGEVQREVDYNLNYMAYVYSMFGYSYDVTDPTIIAETRQSVVNEMVEREVKLQQALAQKLDVLTAEEEERLAGEVAADWDEYVASYTGSQEEGADEAAVRAAAEETLVANGVTREIIRENRLKTLLLEKLQAVTTEGQEASEEEFLSEFSARVEAAKASYEADASAFENAIINGETVYYYPAGGYRLVKNLLVKFTEEDQAKIDDLKGQIAAAEGDTAELQQQLTDATAAAYAAIDEKADAVLARLAAGEDFVTVMKEVGEDTGMNGPAGETGYAVNAANTSMDAAFVSAAMGIANVGEYSDKTPGVYGYYIIQYASEVQEGPVAADAVRESIMSELTSQKKDTYFAEMVAAWVKAADVKIDMKALED